jgi:hypothetical protein
LHSSKKVLLCREQNTHCDCSNAVQDLNGVLIVLAVILGRLHSTVLLTIVYCATQEMSSNSSFPSEPSSAFKKGNQDATVSVHALDCGHFTLPEYQFVHPISRDARKHVPSLAFLIQHQNSYTRQITRIVFDLGLRRDIKRYAAPIQKHIETRQPLTTDPDVTKSLARGGLQSLDIDYVIYSHVC